MSGSRRTISNICARRSALPHPRSTPPPRRSAGSRKAQAGRIFVPFTSSRPSRSRIDSCRLPHIEITSNWGARAGAFSPRPPSISSAMCLPSPLSMRLFFRDKFLARHAGPVPLCQTLRCFLAPARAGRRHSRRFLPDCCVPRQRPPARACRATDRQSRLSGNDIAPLLPPSGMRMARRAGYDDVGRESPTS